MRQDSQLGPAPLRWDEVASRMRVVTLSAPLLLLFPALAFPTAPKATRGLTLYPGRGGAAIGTMVLGSAAVLGGLLFGPTYGIGTFLSVWLLGTAGAATLVTAFRPTAFVKPICVRCRLLPVIKEHEAIHLTGVSSEKAVWDSMKSRHSVSSLSLQGDPSICPFCPIPKRLSEH
jgi:hypothetical protein